MIFASSAISQETSSAVNRALALKRLPQSIMLSGGSVGLREKCTQELCLAALCSQEKSPCMKCDGCKKIINGVHPDIIRVLPERDRKTLSIENIRRQVFSTLASFPNEADGKIYIFPDADSLSPLIQNALLKTIEEPPENVMFIFQCEKRESLLPTVISRLTQYHLGDTLSAQAEKEDERLIEITKAIASALAKEDEFALMLSCAPMKKNRALMSQVAKQLILLIRDALALRSLSCAASHCEAEAYSLFLSYSAASLMKIKYAMDKIIEDAQANANENLLITRFSSLLAVIMKERLE